MSKSKIEWTEHVWNPVTGCTPISPGCANCFAKRMASRLRGRFGYPFNNPFKPTFHVDKINLPYLRKKPTTFFVCSMGDLFHEDIPTDTIYAIIKRMGVASQHTYKILTKRPRRMCEYFTKYKPGKNVHLGVTVCNNDERDKIDYLLHTPAAVRFVSAEPMLSELDIEPYLTPRECTLCETEKCDSYGDSECRAAGNEPNAKIDGVICGCESGPKRRPTNIDWIRGLRDQCVDAGVPFFLKQMEIKGKLVKMPELDGVVHDQLPGVKP